MNLIIDVGNTYVKFAVFQEDELLEQLFVEPKYFFEKTLFFLEKYPRISHSVLSSVAKIDEKWQKALEEKTQLLRLDSQTPMPFTNLYATPTTLGVDRLALVSAAVKLYPKKHALIIDAGTCITYDFVTANKDFLGGAISPGLRMRYRSLNNLTANLPLLEIKAPNELVGNSTENAIHSGVVIGVLKEIEGVVQDYKLKYSDLTVILTGGDSYFLSKQLKSSIFANSNFLLQGLNHILQFNTTQ